MADIPSLVALKHEVFKGIVDMLKNITPNIAFPQAYHQSPGVFGHMAGYVAVPHR